VTCLDWVVCRQVVRTLCSHEPPSPRSQPSKSSELLTDAHSVAAAPGAISLRGVGLESPDRKDDHRIDQDPNRPLSLAVSVASPGDFTLLGFSMMGPRADARSVTSVPSYGPWGAQPLRSCRTKQRAVRMAIRGRVANGINVYSFQASVGPHPSNWVSLETTRWKRCCLAPPSELADKKAPGKTSGAFVDESDSEVVCNRNRPSGEAQEAHKASYPEGIGWTCSKGGTRRDGKTGCVALVKTRDAAALESAS
jgi:hypothetical protein